MDIGDFVEDLGFPGLVVGIGAVVLAPIFGPTLAKAGKPLAKRVIKTGIVTYEKGKVVLAEASESFRDLLSESKAELAQEKMKRVVEVSTDS